MSSKTPRIAVIGAGGCGLPAIKSCLEEGLDPVCYEGTGDIGGLWNYSEESVEGRGSVMRCTVTNSSKELMCYTDFLMPKHYANSIPRQKCLEYLQMYAEHFDLVKNIRLNCYVEKVVPAEDFAETGRWVVHVHHILSGRKEQAIFDAVMVCTGLYSIKNMPKFTGLDEFRGKILHARDFRDARGFENQTVVVVGGGNSAGDLATELSRVAKQTYMSTRTGAWTSTRLGPNGRPFDLDLISRSWMFLCWLLPSAIHNSIIEARLNDIFDHANFGMQPRHRFDARIPLANDELPYRIMDGRIIVKANISRILPNGVEFSDGSHIDRVDAIAFATGYAVEYPLLRNGGIDLRADELYINVFPPKLEKPTLAMIGCLNLFGSMFGVAEMQARWAAQVFKGDRVLPSKEAMLAAIRSRKTGARKLRPYEIFQGHFVPLMDELAEQVGCKPNMGKLWLTDPRLAWKCFFGPCTALQYRLCGPHPWKEARRAILELDERVLAPTHTRRVSYDVITWSTWRLMALSAGLAAVGTAWILGNKAFASLL